MGTVGALSRNFFFGSRSLRFAVVQPIDSPPNIKPPTLAFDCHAPQTLTAEVADAGKFYNKTNTGHHPTKQFCTWWQSSTEPDGEITSNLTSYSCASASLILFGVPKEFDRIWKNYLKYIVHRNPNIQFEVHMHMYADLTNFSNAKNNEINVTTQSPSDIQRILSTMGVRQSGNKNVTLPMKLITSSQKEYDNAGLSWIQERDTKPISHLSIDSLKNMFRQGNSIQQAFISASTQSLLGNLTAEIMAKKTYLFLRSDTLLISPIDIPCSGLAANEIHVPSWQTKNFPEYNDRTALAGSTAAYKYARAKSDVFREMILDERNKTGEVPKLRLHNPEKMLKLYLDHGDGVKLRVKERDLRWAQLIRVRSGGMLADAGRWGVKQKYLNETTL